MIKKILPLKSIKNKTLRERKDLSRLDKTAVHRWHEGNCDFKEWLKLLTPKERNRVKGMFVIDNEFWDKHYGLPYGLSKEDSVWAEVLKIVKEKSGSSIRYHDENSQTSALRQKFNITRK